MQTLKLDELKKQRAAYQSRQTANSLKLSDLRKQKADYEEKKAAEEAEKNDAVAKIERQLSEVRAANVKKAANAVAGRAKDVASKAVNAKVAGIMNAAASGEADWAPQQVSATQQAKIANALADSKLQRGTALYKQQAELTNRYLNAGTADEQSAAKMELDALQKQLPAKGLERAVNAIGGGLVSLEAGAAKMLNPTAKDSGADRVLENIERANVTGKAGLGAVGGVMYDAVQTATNNVGAIAVGAATGGAVNPLALMGTSAAGSSVREAQQAGANDNVAVVAGAANGVLEAAFEKVPLENLFKLAKGANADKMVKDGLKGYAMAVAKQAGLEGASEGATTLAQDFANEMMYERQLNPEKTWLEFWQDTGKDVAYSVLLGGIVGGAMGAPAAVAGRAQALAAQEEKGAQETAKQMMNEAPGPGEGTQTQENALRAAQTAEGEETMASAGRNSESGQNSAENNSWKERYYNEGERVYLYSRDMQRGYEIPEKTELSYTVDKNGGVKLKTALVPELDTADYKDFAKAYAAHNLITEFDSNGNVTNAKPVQIAEDGKQVIITQKGINDVLKNVRGNRKSASLLDSIFVLDDIIAGARKVGEAENAKGRVNPYSYYKNKFVDSAGREYSVTVNIKDTPETSRYHYHNLQEAEIKIEPFDGTSADNDTIAGADLIAKGSKVSLQPLGAGPAPNADATSEPTSATPGSQPGADIGANSLDSYNIPSGENYVKPGAENSLAGNLQNEQEGVPKTSDGGQDSLAGNLQEEWAQASELCKKLGVKLGITNLPEGVSGRYADGVIFIDMEAGEPVREVFIHELTHHLEQSGGYAEYAEFVLRDFELEHGKVALKSYKRQVQEAYAAMGEVLTEEGATREVVADYTAQMLAGDENAIGRLADYNGNLFQRIARWLKDMVAKVRGTTSERWAVEVSRKFNRALHRTNGGDVSAIATDGRAQNKINPNFASQIDSWDGKTQVAFELGTTSEALRSIGIDDRRIVMHGAKVQKILQKHAGMSINVIKQVPEILENPVAVLKSKQAESRIAVFGEVQDELGVPVLAVLELNPHNRGGEVLDLNIVASAYGKDSNPAGFVENSDILYLDDNKKRTDSWFQSLGLQLPSDKTSYGSLGSVTYTNGKVNIQGVPFEQIGENTGGKGQYKIAMAENGTKFVEVEQDILQGKDEKDVPRVLAEVVQNKFAGKIEVNGQDIYVNQQTRREWQFSKEARRLYENENEVYKDKIRVFGNADELLEISRNYINEGLKHPRKDKFVGFARGKVDFKVGENGYTADVVVGIYPDGKALLYDLVGIKSKKIKEAPITDTTHNSESLSRFEASTGTSVSPAEENVKGQNKKQEYESSLLDSLSDEEVEDWQRTFEQRQRYDKYGGEPPLPSDAAALVDAAERAVAEAEARFDEKVKGHNKRKLSRKQMMENAKKQQAEYDAEERELRRMELEDEARDAKEAARAAVSEEDVKNNVYAGLDRAYAIKEFGDKAIELYGIRKGQIGAARAHIEEYAKEALRRRKLMMNNMPTEELADFLYSEGGVYDDSLGQGNLGIARAMDDYKIFVPAEVRENIGGFNAVKKDCKLALQTKTANGSKTRPADKSWARIDDVYEELQEQFGEGMFPELDNQTARLQRLIEVREEVEPEFLSWDKLGDQMGADVAEKLQLELNKLVNEFAHLDDKIAKERESVRAGGQKHLQEKYSEVAHKAEERCQGNRDTGEEAVDVPEDMALEMMNAQFIKDPGAGVSLANRDLTQGLELVSRHNMALREWLKEKFLRPLDRAKAECSKMVKEEMGKINAYMAKHNFKKGSAESAAIQRIGEGKRQLTKDEMVDFTQQDYDERMKLLEQAQEIKADDELKERNPVLWEQVKNCQNPKAVEKAKRDWGKWLKDGKRPPEPGETVPYTLADLQREFPERWQEIQAAAEFCREVYDRVFDDIEAAYNRIYPNAAKKELEKVLHSIESKTEYAALMRTKAEADELAAAKAEVRMEQNRALAEKYEREGKGASARKMRNVIKAQERVIKGLREKAAHRRENAKRAEDMIIHLQAEYNSGNALRQKHIKYRKNYFHHYKEKGGLWQQTKDIWLTPAEISSNLAGISDFTKPNSRFHGFLEGRSGNMAYTEDAFGGLQAYMQEAATAIYIDPVIKDFRQKIAGMAKATESTCNANQTILWLTRMTDALAGKTSSLDRPVQELSGRKLMKTLKLYSGRMRANSVMYNISTFFVQCGNWPNLQLMGVSAKNQVMGLRDWLECNLAPNSQARELLSASDFMRERYLDDVINQMDYRKNIWGKPKKLANFMLQFGDEMVARHIWFVCTRNFTRIGKKWGKNGCKIADIGIYYKINLHYGINLQKMLLFILI